MQMQIVKYNRKLDRLGRITIPITIRKTMNLNINDEVEFYYDEENQMFGVKSVNTKNQVESKIKSLETLIQEISPNKSGEITSLLMKIKKTLGIDDQERKKDV